MTEPSLLELFVRPIATTEIPYFVTGGVATIVYGEPRFTRDIDLVLAVQPVDAVRFLALWPPAEFAVPPPEAFEAETARARHGHFNLIHMETGLVADCYVAGDDPLHAWAFEHVRSFQVGDIGVRVAPVEYVIVRKLSYFTQSGSTRHLEDIARMCRVQGDRIDAASIERWAVELDVLPAWRRARNLDPDSL
ncbi:MAG: nucleotidyl transferase AbiEii/AbiGii toxin family protein [Cytophagaceae bacterium]|nr:nucleotidyl transferase AbiEii/AbiGii toxin family protein [Gemmatimonadaceae bacterium]